MKNLMFVFIALIVAGISMESIAQENNTYADNNEIVKMKSSKEAVKVKGEAARKAKRQNVKMKKMKMRRAKATMFTSHPQINARPAEKAIKQKIRKDKINKIRKQAE